MSFTYPESTANSDVGDDYTLETYVSGALSSEFERNAEQVPFSLSTPGPRYLRGRSTAYASTLGGKSKK